MEFQNPQRRTAGLHAFAYARNNLDLYRVKNRTDYKRLHSTRLRVLMRFEVNCMRMHLYNFKVKSTTKNRSKRFRDSIRTKIVYIYIMYNDKIILCAIPQRARILLSLRLI